MSITNASGDFDKKYIKIKFNLNDTLLLNEIFQLYNLTVVVRSVFQDERDEKYYPQLFLDECLNDASQGIDVNKRNASRM